MAKKPAGMKTQKALPRKLSSLIRIALDDIKKAEASNYFAIDMGRWFDPDTVTHECGKEFNMCLVCAAGSVMAYTLGGNGYRDGLSPLNFPKSRRQLEAIDELRQGDVSQAGAILGFSDTKVNALFKYDRYITSYDDDRDVFHADMERLYRDLKKAGL